MKKVEEIKDALLHHVIHMDERYDEKFRELYDHIGRIVRWKEETGEESSYILFLQMAGMITYYRELILVCNDLKKRLEPKRFDYDYYTAFFNKHVTSGTALLRKLRPYVLKYTSHWSAERKQKDLDHKKCAHYLKGWYLPAQTNMIADGPGGRPRTAPTEPKLK